MGQTFSEIQSGKEIKKNTSAGGKNEKIQNARKIPDTRAAAGRNAAIQKTGK